jgi:hypothetical protein
MMQWLGRWLLRVLISFAVVTLAAFVLDFAVYKFRGSPQSQVVVSRFLSIPLKGQKTEYDFLGTANVPCVVALFPQSGEAPCWYLQLHPNQWDNAGSPAY